MDDPSVSRRTGPREPRKLNLKALAGHVDQYPDMTQAEWACHFKVSRHCIWYNLRKLNVKLRVKCTSNLRVKVHHFEDVQHHQNGSPTINQSAQEQRVE